MRYAIQRIIPRVVLEDAYDPSEVIGHAVQDMLDDLIPVAGFDIQTLGIGGRWDALIDSFLVSAKVQEVAE